MSAGAISHKWASERGWERVDPRPWRKTSALWRHRDGWRLEHCGHPTALYPWALYDAKGRMHLTGINFAKRNPTFGVAWSNPRDPMTYVAVRGAWGVERMDDVERAHPSSVRRAAA